MSKTMTLKPRMSEKAYATSVAKNTYVIDVPTDATKLTVAAAVEAQFDVKVKSVRVVLAKGKTKRTVRKGGRPTMGQRSDVKKAYVTLKDGQSLPFFAEVEAEANAAKEEKPAKKAKKEEK